MADGEAPGGPRAGGGVSAWWNRLPTGGKAAVLVGGAAVGFLAVRWYKNRKSGSAAGTTLQVAGPATPFDPGSPGGSFGGGGGFGPPFPTGMGGGGQTPPPFPTDPSQTQAPDAKSTQPPQTPTLLQSPAGTPIPNSAPIIGTTTSQGWSGLPPAGSPIYSYTASQVPGAIAASPTSEYVPGFGYLPPGSVIQGPGVPAPLPTGGP